MTIHMSTGRITNVETGEELPGVEGREFTLHWDSPDDDERMLPFVRRQQFVAQLLSEAVPLLSRSEENRS